MFVIKDRSEGKEEGADEKEIVRRRRRRRRRREGKVEGERRKEKGERRKEKAYLYGILRRSSSLKSFINPFLQFEVLVCKAC
jgi:hypothetical protein